MERWFRDKRNIVILFLFVLFCIKLPQEEMRFILWVLGGIFLCSIFDFFINILLLKKIIFPKSAIITGFIVSGILDYNQSLAFLIIFSLTAILSKHILRFNKKHMFNPANFSLFLATILGLPLTWNIESNIYLIIGMGIYLVYRLKKISHAVGFLISFIIIFTIVHINPLSIISWFFILIMLIEPKTSGYGIIRGFVFGSISGVTSYLIFRFLPKVDFLVVSLFCANLCNPLLDQLRLPSKRLVSSKESGG